jgi:golgi to ER traffic protein 4
MLASRTFITHFVSALPRSYYLQQSTISASPSTEITFINDPLVNFCQLAVLTCQRAQGADNKVMRESWVRLCGTYQSKGGPLASPEVRKVFRAHEYFLSGP